MKKIAIVQSNYIPWKGYFDLVNMVDEFVLYDDMQYTRRDWRNRNKIATPSGLKWLTIPVAVKGKYFEKINEVNIADMAWSKAHWQTIKQFYSKAEYFREYANVFESFYLDSSEMKLSSINRALIEIINDILGIDTKVTCSSQYQLPGGQTENLMAICEQAGADVYLSGPAAREYFDASLAKIKGIEVEWMDYSGYPVYRQLHQPFEHGVTVLDLIFNEGPKAGLFMKSFIK